MLPPVTANCYFTYNYKFSLSSQSPPGLLLALPILCCHSSFLFPRILEGCTGTGATESKFTPRSWPCGHDGGRDGLASSKPPFAPSHPNFPRLRVHPSTRNLEEPTAQHLSPLFGACERARSMLENSSDACRTAISAEHSGFKALHWSVPEPRAELSDACRTPSLLSCNPSSICRRRMAVSFLCGVTAFGSDCARQRLARETSSGPTPRYQSILNSRIFDL